MNNGIDVVPFDHEDANQWILDDEDVYPELVYASTPDGYSNLRADLTAVRRDIHGLEVMCRERPDIVSLGSYHALKFDMLLGRSGERSFYYLDEPFNWDSVLWGWKRVHDVYRQELHDANN